MIFQPMIGLAGQTCYHTPMQTLTIATRESQLALWQANFVKQQLQQQHPDLTIKLLGITTTGDREQDKSLQAIGGKGVFLKELQQALLAKRADIAVHSMKDVPNDRVDGLTIPVICPRDDASDAFIANHYQQFTDLPPNAIVGTSSVRRTAQLLALRPDLQIRLLRGNVDTRLAKLDAGDYDAIVLSAAGLIRLGWQQRIAHCFAAEQMLPSVGQGAIGIECRSEDAPVQRLIQPLNHHASQQCVLAERAFTERLQGDCHSPIGVFAELVDDTMQIKGIVADSQGKTVLRSQLSGAISPRLGQQLAQALIEQGAMELLGLAK